MRHLTCLLGFVALVVGSTAPSAAQSVAGSGLTVTASPQAGEYAVRVSGIGPASSQILLHLSMMLSADLPTVALNDAMTMTDAEGNYAATVPLATDYWYGSLVNVEADAPDSGAEAKTTFTTVPPNHTFKSKVDVVPSQ